MKAMMANGVRSTHSGDICARVHRLDGRCVLADARYRAAQRSRGACKPDSRSAASWQHDNDLLADSRALPAADSRRLGVDDGAHVYPARKGGKTVAAVLEAIAPDGYAGKIAL